MSDLSSARRPRGIVKLNGVRIDAWVSWEVDNNAFYQADTFRALINVAELPAANDLSWIAAQEELDIEIFGGVPIDADNYSESDLKSLFFGRVDSLDYDPVARTIDLSGRDLTGLLTDAKTTESFSNQSSTQIAQTLAGRHGLTAEIPQPTRVKVGAYYETQAVTLNHERTEWDLLTYLANYEGFVIRVRGKTLYFGPAPDPEQSKYPIVWTAPSKPWETPTAPVTTLKLSHNLTLAKDVVVVFKGFDIKKHKPITVTVKKPRIRNSVTSSASPLSGPAQVYTQFFYKPTTREVLLQKAQAFAQSVSAHEYRLSADMPADDVLDVITPVVLSGLGSPWDQTYFPDSIVRGMNRDDGYRMRLNAKNHSPESTVSA